MLGVWWWFGVGDVVWYYPIIIPTQFKLHWTELNWVVAISAKANCWLQILTFSLKNVISWNLYFMTFLILCVNPEYWLWVHNWSIGWVVRTKLITREAFQTKKQGIFGLGLKWKWPPIKDLMYFFNFGGACNFFPLNFSVNLGNFQKANF